MSAEKRINVKALALTGGVLWGGAVLLVGVCHYIWPGYGLTFLQVLDSIYPGYHAVPSLEQALIAAGYALLDGAITGFLVAVLYNLFAGGKK
jgi:hypothetical protein